jgi:hypothetical protein
VFDRVRAIRDGEWVYPPPITDAQLDETESQLGSRLPESYRVFMKRFGPGCFDGLVYVMPISPRGKGRAAETVATRTAFLRKVFNKPSYYSNHEMLSRLVYFAGHTNNNAEYAWDPAVGPPRNPHECRFFTLYRLQEDEPVNAGGSLGEFLTWLVAEIGVQLERDPATSPDSVIVFRLTPLRAKKRPQKRDVKAWLAANNHTARELALSIRDRGQTDAFPILADALEEAGCTNADLLDSCRHGDLDIDGAWVLQVLLGKK